MEQIEIILPKQKCLEQALSLRVGVVHTKTVNPSQEIENLFENLRKIYTTKPIKFGGYADEGSVCLNVLDKLLEDYYAEQY